MAFKLDDFLSKKKEPAQVLDLSRVKITSKEEFRKYLDRVPEFKIKPEKVTAENIRIRDKDFTFVAGKQEERKVREWSFPDPTPPDMRAVKLEDLCPVNIDWKMLTTLRPKTKVEEEMFSRLVQLGKLDLKHQQLLLREKTADWVRRTKNPRSSIVEVRVLSCKECGEDFCDGSLCSMLTYDNFSRQSGASADAAKNFQLADSVKASSSSSKKKGKKKKKKKEQRKCRKRKRSNRGTKKMKPRKNSIFNRPPTRGCSRDHSRRGKVETRSSSLNRIQTEKKPTFIRLNRSKSAPRLRFRRDTSDPAFAYRSEYASDSGPTQTDYSTQSDSDADDGSSPDFKHSRIVHFDGRKTTTTTESDTDGDDDDDDDDDNNKSPPGVRATGASISSRKSKHPTHIDITFDGLQTAGTAGVFVPRRSYLPSKMFSGRGGGGPGRRRPMTSVVAASVRNQEVTRLGEGFARIDLSFVTDDEEVAGGAVPALATAAPSPRRVSSRVSRPRFRPERDVIPSTSCVTGKGLLGKFLNLRK